MSTHLIPKLILQTSKVKPEQYVLDQIYCFTGPEYRYIHFNDDEVIDFLKLHPISDFPLIIEKFCSFENGAHKADLFRYYFIYLFGGIFIDSDAIPRSPLNPIIENCDFFSVNSSFVPESIFQGFIGAKPNHPILYTALKNLYDVNIEHLRADYHFFCRDLYKIIHNSQDKTHIKLLEENVYTTNASKVINEKNQTVLLHFWKDKKIPKKYYLYL